MFSLDVVAYVHLLGVRWRVFLFPSEVHGNPAVVECSKGVVVQLSS